MATRREPPAPSRVAFVLAFTATALARLLRRVGWYGWGWYGFGCW